MRVILPNDKFKNIKMGGGIRDIVDLSGRLEKSGKEIYHLEIGSPDFDSPSVSKDAAKSALDRGLVQYADMRGVYELRETLSEKLKRENNIETSPANLLITAGAQAAMTAAMLSCLNKDDEVLVQTPCFSGYVSLCAISETKLVPIECEIKSSFRLDTRELEEKITDRSKLLVLNSPNNPTGSVLSRKTLEDIAEIAIKNDLLVLSDECYEKFIYGGGEHVSIASIPGMSQRTITIGSSSKTYAMTGWRVGYIVVPDSLLPYVLRMHSIICTCVGTFNQYGYMEALRHADNDVRNMIAEYEKRRELVLGYMKQMPILDFAVPEGAFYFFPNVSKTGMNSTEFCSYMLNEAGVAMVPGDVFHGVDSVRFAYCKPIDYLRSAMERFKAAIDKI